MKLLLDENLPHTLRQHLPGHEVFTTAFMNWGGIEYQQNLTELPCSVVIIRAPSNAFEHIEPLLPKLIEALQSLSPRSLIKVG